MARFNRGEKSVARKNDVDRFQQARLDDIGIYRPRDSRASTIVVIVVDNSVSSTIRTLKEEKKK